MERDFRYIDDSMYIKLLSNTYLTIKGAYFNEFYTYADIKDLDTN